MNDPNQGQNQGQPQAAPMQPPPVLPAPPQAQPVQPQPAAPLLPPPPPPAAQAAPPFTLAPGHNDHILDWTNPAHTKQYYKATSPLDSTEKFLTRFAYSYLMLRIEHNNSDTIPTKNG